MNQSMPWMKFSHVEYLLAPNHIGLSLAARGALTLLMSHAARQQPYGSLPNDFDLIGRMVGKGWSNKIKSELFGPVFVASGDRWTYALMTDVWADKTEQPKPPQPEPDPSAPKTRAEIQKEYRDRNKGKTESVTNTVTSQSKSVTTALPTVTNSVTESGNAPLPSVTTTVTTALPNEGGKGGDLDLDQDLDLEESVRVTPCAVTVSNTDPLSFTRHTLSQTGFTVLEIPKQFASLAMQRNSQLTDADLNVIWSRLLDWSSKDEQADVKRNWFNTWIARINSDAAVTITNRLKHQDTPTTATVVEAACYRTIRTPVAKTAQALTDEQLAEMQRNKSALLAQLTEDVA